jgi:uncharacterized membrane protein YhhN
MYLYVYSALFWILAVITIVLKTKTEDRSNPRTVIKMSPAILAALIVLFTIPAAQFFLVLMIALVFCALGDVGMEYNILPGLGLFLFGHIFYIIFFVMETLTIGLTFIPLAVFGVCFAVMLIYIVFYYRYINTTEQDIPEVLLKSVIVYALMISLTLSTSLLLWLTTNAVLGYLPFIGACFFVASDSLIGVKEFHHHFHKYEEVVILSTYYLAIFLLSFGVFIYA